jgi:hypothetical protein
MKKIESLISLVIMWCGTPRTRFAINEDDVCRWNSTPLIGGSVSLTPTQTLLLASKARGVLATYGAQS